MLISSMKREVIDGRLVVGGVPAHCKDCLYGQQGRRAMEALDGSVWALCYANPERYGYVSPLRTGTPREAHAGSGVEIRVFYESDHIRHCILHDKHPCWLPDTVRFCPEFVPARPVAEGAYDNHPRISTPPCACGKKADLHVFNIAKGDWEGFCAAHYRDYEALAAFAATR